MHGFFSQQKKKCLKVVLGLNSWKIDIEGPEDLEKRAMKMKECECINIHGLAEFISILYRSVPD